jgi:tetratricopeptide (TPR) repeat protein
VGKKIMTIQMKPDWSNPSNNRGKSTYYKLGQYREAIQAFKEATRMRPDDALAYFGLGTAYYNFGQYSKAIAAFEEALRIKPNYAYAQVSLGLVYLALNDSASALKQYEVLSNTEIEKANDLFNLIYHFPWSTSDEGHQ